MPIIILQKLSAFCSVNSTKTPLVDMMIIDCEKVANLIVEFIKRKVQKEEKDAVVLGLSGGIDSSTVAFLAERAIETSKVHALYLPDQDSEGKSQHYAQEVARKLGLTFKTIVITKEMPFIVALEKGRPAKNPLTRLIYRVTGSVIERGFNIRHRARRRILEEYAQSHNLLLVGCANRSESFVGWFVKDGVDDLPVEPILGLYKNQVRQLARYVGVPEEILREASSPDMLKRIGDENIIGYSYDKIDKVAYVLEHNLNSQLAFNNGVTPEELEEIKRIHALSEWKRENLHECPIFNRTEIEAGLT